MNTLKSNLIFLICIFPVWVIKFKFSVLNYFLIISFLLVLFIFHNLIINYFQKKPVTIINQIYYSFLIAYGVDNHLGIHSGVSLNYMEFWVNLFNSTYGFIYYTSLIIFFLLIVLNLTIIRFLREKGLIILSIFTLSILLFALIDQTRSHKNINQFNRTVGSDKFKKKKVIIVLDEFSGVNSYESQTSLGKQFDKLAKDLAKKHNLSIYENIYTTHANTTFSISSMLNKFKKHRGTKAKNYFIKDTKKSFYSEYTLEENKLFDKYKSISVYQNIHINFCKNKNVKKCDEFNPFVQTSYMKGFKDTSLSKIINAWKFDGSITGAFAWRILREFNIIDVTISPQGEKATFTNLLNKIFQDIKSKDYDLIFAHTLVPHKPYGYNKDCNYDGKKSLKNYSGVMSLKEHTKNHNIDRICTLKFLDDFLQEVKNKNLAKNLEIQILSDHGSRNQINDPTSSLNTIFFHKLEKTFFQRIERKSNLQEVFIRINF